jgi:protease IV
MNKYMKILVFLGILWIVSYGIAGFLQEDGSSTSTNKIAIIPIQGAITMNGASNVLQSSTSAKTIIENIKTANENDNVKGIVLDINSPGGTVLASKHIADAVKEVDKPVVAYISEFGTSGAYWAASQADLIVSDELSFVGSIGVLGSYLEFSGFLDTYNISYNRLVTGEYKDINSPLKKLSEEEEALIQERLDAIHNYFVEDVANGRDMHVEDIDALANGLFYLGMEGVNIGLIDELGNKEYAINRTEELAGIDNGEIDEYLEKEGWLSSILTEYTTYSSYYIGQGIGSVLLAKSSEEIEIRV